MCQFDRAKLIAGETLFMGMSMRVLAFELAD